MDGRTQQSVGSRQEAPGCVLPAPLNHLYPALPHWVAAAQPDSQFMEHSFTEPLLCARRRSLSFTSSCSKRCGDCSLSKGHIIKSLSLMNISSDVEYRQLLAPKNRVSQTVTQGPVCQTS